MSSALEILFSVAVRVSVLIGLAWGAAFLLRRRSARIRHLVWTSAAVGALVLLASAPFAPTVRTTQLPVWQNCSVGISPVHIELSSCGREEPAEMASAGPEPDGTPQGGTARPEDTPAAPPATSSGADGREAAGSLVSLVPGISSTPELSLSTVLFGLWAAGALVVLLAIFLERLWIRRLSRSAREADEAELLEEARELARGLDLPGRIDLHLSSEAVAPLSWGVWRPRILLPERAASWPEDQRRAVLLHELGHARRRDVFTQTLAAVSCAVFWFNPLVWLAASRMRDERERACDDLVLHSGVGSTSYAQCLLDLARRLSPSSGSRIAVVGMTRGPDLIERVERLVSRAGPRKPPGPGTTVVSTLGALTVIGVLAPHVVAQPDCRGRDVESRPTVGASTTDPGQPVLGGNRLAGVTEDRSPRRSTRRPATADQDHLSARSR